MADRLERLFNLLAQLLTTPRPLTLEEIVQDVPGYPEEKASYRRQFERDKETLRDLGVEISVMKLGEFDTELGYRVLPQNYYIDEPDLTTDERAALHVAATAVALGGETWREGMWKLGGLEGQAAPPLATLPFTPALSDLFDACRARAQVDFTYRGERRHVDPHGLAFSRGHWYLAAYDHDRQHKRTFRVDRIEAAEAGPPGAFERPAGIDLEAGLRSQPWELSEDVPVVAELRVDKTHAPWIVAQLGEEAVASRDENGVIVRMQVSNRAAFRSFVLGLLDHAEVLAPVDLREELVTWLEDVVAS